MDPSKEDLAAVFAGPEGGPPPPPTGDMSSTNTDDMQTEEALDAAIDEAFDSTDPVQRREAFKRAMRLCNESY